LVLQQGKQGRRRKEVTPGRTPIDYGDGHTAKGGLRPGAGYSILRAVEIPFIVLATAAVVLIAVAFGLALAHALEMPGKMRVGRDAYLAMQSVYYPGFTIGGGIGEAGGLLATLALLWEMPVGTTRFWLTLVALGGLMGMQVVFWLVTQPVNRFWLSGQKLGRFGSNFFSVGAKGRAGKAQPLDWTYLRDRWEFSHVARAGFAALSLVAIVLAIASDL
jgi:hypothetical protein